MDYKALSEKLMETVIGLTPGAPELFQRKKGIGEREHGYFHTTELLELLRIFDELQTESVLDMGCGAGLLLAQIRCMAPWLQVKGYDNEVVLIEIAQRLVPAELRDIKELRASDIENFDTLYTWCPFVYEKETAIFLNNLLKIMKPTQKVVLSVEGQIPLISLLRTREDVEIIPGGGDYFHIFKLKNINK